MVEIRPQIVVEKRPRGARMRAGSHFGPPWSVFDHDLWSDFDHAFLQATKKKSALTKKKIVFEFFCGQNPTTILVRIRPRIVVGIRPRIVVEKRPRALQRSLHEDPKMGCAGEPPKPSKQMPQRESQKNIQEDPTTPRSNDPVVSQSQ